LVLACAEVIAPPGGEVDTTAPQIISSSPENGATGVTNVETIEIVFSERITRPRTGRAVFISPRQAEAPEIKWKADRLSITLPDTLKPDQTYVISFSSTVTDLRNNQIDSVTSVAFSTGLMLDSGVVTGVVSDISGKPQPSLFVGLYDFPEGDTVQSFDSLFPEYATTTNKAGEFSFRYLPMKNFLLVAFNDKNKDEYFKPRTESYALPDRPANLDSNSSLTGLNLLLAFADSGAVRVVSTEFTADKVIRARLSSPIPMTYLSDRYDGVQLSPVNDSLRILSATGLLEQNERESSTLTFAFPPLDSGQYRLVVPYSEDIAPLVVDTFTIRFKTDKTMPTLYTFLPKETPVFEGGKKIELVFSEPLDTAAMDAQTILLSQSDSIPIPIVPRWIDPFHLEATPPSVVVGESYRIDLNESEIVDLSGNRLGDSIITRRFSIFDPDSLGLVTGEIISPHLADTGTQTILTFTRISDKRVFESNEDERIFSIDLPAGRYLLRAIRDRNADGRLTAGSLSPFRYSEPVSSHRDTIAVRARFETGGIRVEFK